MPTSTSYTASIVVNGKPLTEYDPPDNEQSNDSNECVKYVEVSEGSEFSVHLDLAQHTKFSTPSKVVSIRIDGKNARSAAIPKRRMHHGMHFEFNGRLLQENGQRMEQSFIFKKIVTTDEIPKVEELKKVAREIGTVTVKVYHGTGGDVVKFRGHHREERSEVVPEKALKGQPIDMAAGYGEKKLVRRCTTSNDATIGTAEAVFVFKYRSRRALQLLDLIPATPEPQSLGDRDPKTLSLDEIQMLQSQYRQQGVSIAQTKQEPFKVKQEHMAEAENTSRKRSATWIDDDELQIIKVKKCKPTTNGEVEVLDLS